MAGATEGASEAAEERFREARSFGDSGFGEYSGAEAAFADLRLAGVWIDFHELSCGERVSVSPGIRAFSRRLFGGWPNDDVCERLWFRFLSGFGPGFLMFRFAYTPHLWESGPP